jgi:hypothetical protein
MTFRAIAMVLVASLSPVLYAQSETDASLRAKIAAQDVEIARLQARLLLCTGVTTPAASAGTVIARPPPPSSSLGDLAAKMPHAAQPPSSPRVFTNENLQGPVGATKPSALKDVAPLATRKPAATFTALADLPPDPVGAGRWVVTTAKNPLNDHAIVTAVLTASAPIKGWLATATPELVVRCQTPLHPSTFPPFLPVQSGLEVYVVMGMPATVENAEGKHSLQVRFDDQPARTWGTSESTDKKALFVAPIYATEMLVTKRTLATSKQMLVGFTPFNASPVLITFDVRGFRTNLNRILAACPVMDKSQWKVLS